MRQGLACHLSLVTGARADLVRVSGGAERACLVDDSPLRARWLLGEADRAWRRFGYAEAAALLEQCRRQDAAVDRALLLSRGFAAWDRFDHEEAYQKLREAAGGGLPEWVLPALGELRRGREQATERSDAYRLWDLWLTACRRAEAQAYDVGVLLLYRCLEAMAQWTLRWHHHVDTGDVARDEAERVGIADLTAPDHHGRLVMSMHKAWSAVARLGGPLAEVGARTDERRRDFADRRNHSLLAHGETPLREEHFRSARELLEREAMGHFRKVAFKGREPYPQLPTAIPPVR
ncbi:MAG: TIGR02710 family CRISPR-associated protein [Deltaproteobacteria bacterium]|nr:TIGR02710 family CRISPR-associated protein [Deltaproteobacteria bacterium]